MTARAQPGTAQWILRAMPGRKTECQENLLGARGSRPAPGHLAGQWQSQDETPGHRGRVHALSHGALLTPTFRALHPGEQGRVGKPSGLQPQAQQGALLGPQRPWSGHLGRSSSEGLGPCLPLACSRPHSTGGEHAQARSSRARAGLGAALGGPSQIHTEAQGGLAQREPGL